MDDDEGSFCYASWRIASGGALPLRDAHAQERGLDHLLAMVEVVRP